MSVAPVSLLEVVVAVSGFVVLLPLVAGVTGAAGAAAGG